MRLGVVLMCGLWLGACTLPNPYGPAPMAVKFAPRHCYRTLAAVDCHAHPLAGEDYRQVGFFDAPLAD